MLLILSRVAGALVLRVTEVVTWFFSKVSLVNSLDFKERSISTFIFSEVQTATVFVHFQTFFDGVFNGRLNDIFFNVSWRVFRIYDAGPQRR